MTPETIPLVVPARPRTCRAARRQTAPPGHVELLNLLARAAGYRSYQGLRAAARMPDAAAALDTAQAARR